VRKALIGALVGALVLSVAGVAIATDQFKQTASIKYTKKDVKKSTGFKAKLTTKDPAAQYQKPAGPTSVKVKFAGAKVDTAGADVCDKDDNGITAGQCPSDSEIGDGEAQANAQPLLACTPVLSVKAYNEEKGIALLLRQKGACAGQTLVLHGKWSGKGVKTAANGTIAANNPTLTVKVPALVVLGTKVVLTSFKLTTDPHKKGKHKLVRTPSKCNDFFRVTTTVKFDDPSIKTFKKTTKTRCND
jgi:gas vesicle protein